MKTALFYINGQYWKRLEVTEKDVRRRYREYYFSNKPPDIYQEKDEDEYMIGHLKRVYFRLTAINTFALYDDELYFEDGSVYLREEITEEVTT